MIESQTDRMEHVARGIAPLVLGALILAGCQTATTTPTTEAEPTVAQPASTSMAPEQWVGTWSGMWISSGVRCPSTITVKEVTGTQAVATYAWGSGCGGSMPGEHTDPQAKLSGNNLEVALKFGRRAQYTMRDDGDLDGVWSSRGGTTVLKATFNRQ